MTRRAEDGGVIPWLFGAVAALVAMLTTRKLTNAGRHGETDRMGEKIDTMGYTAETWRSRLAPLCAAHGVPVSFAVAWEDEESAGNPCAIGEPGALGPDGNPKEMGIAQLYNPDDLQLAGVTGNQLRAYCVPTKVQVKNSRGQLVWSHSQSVARKLTAAEEAQQAQALVAKIVQARAEASHWLNAARALWPSDGVDFWRTVKLVHGLPGLVHGLMTVATALGRAPSSWSEFRQIAQAGDVKFDPATEAKRSRFASVFDNAEAAAAGVQGSAVA